MFLGPPHPKTPQGWHTRMKKVRVLPWLLRAWPLEEPQRGTPTCMDGLRSVWPPYCQWSPQWQWQSLPPWGRIKEWVLLVCLLWPPQWRSWISMPLRGLPWRNWQKKIWQKATPECVTHHSRKNCVHNSVHWYSICSYHLKLIYVIFFLNIYL